MFNALIRRVAWLQVAAAIRRMSRPRYGSLTAQTTTFTLPSDDDPSVTAVRPLAHATLDNAAHFAWQQDDVFGRIATRYDLLCDVFSFGFHRLWKRRVVQLIAREPWATLLDGATGTGDIITRL